MYCGVSGGVLVFMEIGELLGMIISYIKDFNLLSSFFYVNFSIFIDFFYKFVLVYKNGVIEDIV